MSSSPPSRRFKFNTPPPIWDFPAASREPSSSDTPAATESKTLRAEVERIEVVHDQIRELLANPLPHTHPDSTPRRIKDRPLNPRGPADSDHALLLQKALKLQGYAGLTDMVAVLARRYRVDPDIKLKKNYDILVNRKHEMEFMTILLTMHYDFLKHLLAGDLMWQYFHDPKFKLAVDQHHKLKKAPGTYLQALVRSEVELIEPDTQSTVKTLAPRRRQNPDAGGWLTGREIYKLYQTARRYLCLKGPESDYQEAHKIDHVHQGYEEKDLSLYALGRRRYVDSANCDRIDHWLESWHATYIIRIQPLIDEEERTGKANPDLDVPFHHCPFEIGYGVDVRQRANAHDGHNSSNRLWTFYLALVNYLFDPDQNVFVIYRFQTNYIAPTTIQDAYPLALLSDVGQTLLARSEWHQGGFNPVPGGGGGVSEAILLRNEQWLGENAYHMYSEHSVFLGNVEKTKAQTEHLRGYFDREKKRPQVRREMEKTYREQKASFEKQETSLKRVKMAITVLEVREMVEQYHKENPHIRRRQRSEDPKGAEGAEGAEVVGVAEVAEVAEGAGEEEDLEGSEGPEISQSPEDTQGPEDEEMYD